VQQTALSDKTAQHLDLASEKRDNSSLKNVLKSRTFFVFSVSVVKFHVSVVKTLYHS
jgi:hypothetical protein